MHSQIQGNIKTAILVMALTCGAAPAALAASHGTQDNLIKVGAVNRKIVVVTTLTTYANLARYIGGERVVTHAIANGDEDAHFVRPKPSFARLAARADLFVTTGLDLELWAPMVIDRSQNARIREGQVGYVAAADGIRMLEIPATADRSQGGVHIYGNPHIHTCPLNIKVMARNIAIGLKKVDPHGAAAYEDGYHRFVARLDQWLYGPELIKLLGGATLDRLALSGNLQPFLEGKSFRGQKLINRLGGWLGRARPLYGKKIVTYHKNWIYLARLLGLELVGEVEPKPAIPPSPRHVQQLIQTMQRSQVQVVLAANYFDQHKIMRICERVGATPVIVPLYTGGAPEASDIFAMFDMWLNMLLKAYSTR